MKKENEVHVTWNHTGKMRGKASLSTSPLINCQCQKNCKNEKWVCRFCYSIKMMKMYKQLATALERNYHILTTSILPFDSLPLINRLDFRFEAFGDLANETHFINYLNICKKNPNTIFAIWTKNPQIMAKVFDDMGYEKPKNLIIIYSNPIVNTLIKLETIQKKYWFIDKTFNVFTKDFLKDHPEYEVNCGAKCCNECNICYSFNDIKELIEVLK